MVELRKPGPQAVRRQVAARSAVKKALERQKLVIAHTRYSQEGMTARVLLDGEYYDVDERRLALLKAGKKPAELGLEPYRGGEE